MISLLRRSTLAALGGFLIAVVAAKLRFRGIEPSLMGLAVGVFVLALVDVALAVLVRERGRELTVAGAFTALVGASGVFVYPLPPGLVASVPAVALVLGLVEGHALRPAERPWRWLGSTRVHGVVLGLGVATFAVAATAIETWRYDNLGVNEGDISVFGLPLWNVLHGHGLQLLNNQTLVRNGGAHPHLFADHAYFGHFFLLPLYALWPDPRALFLAQGLAAGLAAVFVHRLGRASGLSSGASLLVALGYLANPVLIAGATGGSDNGFHMDALFALPFFAACDAHRRGRPRAFVVLALASVLLHERMVMVWVGVALAWVVSGDVRRGLILGAASVGYFVFACLLITAANGGQAPWFLSTASATRAPGEVVRPLATNVGRHLASLLGLPLLSPLALGAVPMLASYAQAWLHSNEVPLDYIDAHAMPVLAALVVATLDALMRLQTRYGWSPRAVHRVAVAVLAANVVAAVLAWEEEWFPPRLSNERRAAFETAAAAIPDQPALAASWFVGAHFLNRERLYTFPFCYDARLVFVDTRPARPEFWGELEAREWERLRAEPGARVVFDREGFFVLERVVTPR